MTIATGLTLALHRLGIDVVSVSVGALDDRATWRIEYGSATTVEQMTTAEALKLTYAVETDTASVDEQAASQLDDQKMVKALAIWTAQKLNIPLATMRTEVLARYRAL